MSSRRRGEQGEQARGDDGQLLDAAEPERIREQAADGAQPHVAEYRAAVDGGRKPLEDERQWQQEQPARRQLPARVCDRPDTGRAPPALGEDHPESRRGDAADRRHDPDDVELRGRAQHHESDTARTDCGGGCRKRTDPVAEHERPQTEDDQRLHSGDCRCDAAGQPFCGEEQQREERADVEDAESQRLHPPAARRKSAAQSESHQPRGERSEEAGQQRMTGGQQLGRHEVRRAPGDGGQRCEEQQSQPVHDFSLCPIQT